MQFKEVEVGHAMNIDHFITFIEREEDKIYLRTKLLPVNIRLYNSDKTTRYRDIVRACCEYITCLCMTKMEGYKLPHGMSGANAAIPFNIIGIAQNRGKSNASCRIMINPKIIGVNGKKELTKTNCGSIRLKDPIKVWRYSEIEVEYHDIHGVHRVDWYDREKGSFTIQHEIDHNNGILITDL